MRKAVITTKGTVPKARLKVENPRIPTALQKYSIRASISRKKVKSKIPCGGNFFKHVVKNFPKA